MARFFLFFYFLGSVGIGAAFSYVFFYVREKEKFLLCLKQCDRYEHSLQSMVKDLDRELSVRKDLEQRLRSSDDSLKKLYAKLAVSEERLSSLSCYREKFDIVTNELRVQREINILQESELKKISSSLEEKHLAMLEKEKFFFNFENIFSEKFEILANRVFEYSGDKIDVQNKLSLDKLLSPLRLQLDGFKEDMKKRFSQEECERHMLSHEIHNLQRLNAKMAQETINLTHALKGSNKLQGNWGEVILNRVLEASGMREGHEFHAQSNIRTDDGRRLQPDVIVHLPDNKDIVIDAKTSLLSYEQYFNSKNDHDKKIALSSYITSLRTHMKSLSKKDYQSLYEGQAVDYVLMFVPIESAFMLALDTEPSLLTESIEYNIMLVSPTTLLVALRIINNLWRYEYQNRHVKEIADRASRLYDKIRLFVEDINKVGQYLDKVHESYCAAKNKLFLGSGNIISQAERFRVFGVKVKRPIMSKKGIVLSSLDDVSSDRKITNNTVSSSCMNKSR